MLSSRNASAPRTLRPPSQSLELPMEFLVNWPPHSGVLHWFHGAELEFVTHAPLEPSDVVQARVYAHDGSASVRAALMVTGDYTDAREGALRRVGVISKIEIRDRERLLSWIQARRSTLPPRDPIAPAVVAQPGRLQVHWMSPEGFLCAWRTGLARGRLELSEPKETLQTPGGRIYLRLLLPDHQVVGCTGRLTSYRRRWVVTLSPQSNAMRALQRAAQWCEAASGRVRAGSIRQRRP